jgi:hypothetical protein
MAKKVLPEVLPETNEQGNNKSTPIKALIVAGTFLAIATLSVVTRGLNDARPSAGVIAVRIALLSACTVVYFGMLYHTRASRLKDKKEPATGKK